MKTILLLLLVCVMHTTFANNYYFSSSSGDDNRSAAQAQNPATPWRSINKLNSFFGSLNGGDAVYFRRGETFYGSIRPSKSGNDGQPIVISAYGDGARPVITGFTSLGNWVNLGNGIWETTNGSLGGSVNSVTINGKPQEMGRYPNSNTSNKGYLNYEGHSINQSITDHQLSASTNWTGAEVVIRKNPWILDRGAVVGHSGNTIYYKSGSSYHATDNFGYFIQDDIRTLDQFGEWHYNESQKKMFVYFGSSSPSSVEVKASTVDNVVHINSINNILFDNLYIEGANVFGLWINGARNIHVRDCNIVASGDCGVKGSYNTSLTIEGVSINHSNNNGIDLENDNNGSRVRANKVENTALFAGMGKSGDGNGTGINVRGQGNVIEYNEVLNTGYNGISFYDDMTMLIKNNYVNNFSLTKSDGGGIYCHRGNTGVITGGRRIIGNIVVNGIGAGEGTDNPSYLIAEGIYLDDGSSGTEVAQNTVGNVPHYGILYNNAKYIISRDNTFFNNGCQMEMLFSSTSPSDAHNEVTGNILFSKKASQKVISLRSTNDDINQFAQMDRNYYARPLDDKLDIHLDRNYATFKEISEALDLQTWQSRYNKDGNSTKSPVEIAPFTINSIGSGNKFIHGDGAFSSNTYGVGVWTPAGNGSVKWANNVLDGGSVHVSFSPTIGATNTAVVTMGVGAVSSSKKYILRYSLKGSTNNGYCLGAYLRKDGEPYNDISKRAYVKISTTRTENELLFTIPESQPNATLMFIVNNQNQEFWLDNIRFTEADVTETNPDDYIHFEYNPSNSSRTVSLNGNFVDVKNNSYASTITLPPYGSAVLIRSGNTTTPVVANPVVAEPPIVTKPITVVPPVVTTPITVAPPVVSNPIITEPPIVAVTQPVATCSATGTILREQWDNITGDDVAKIPLNNTPDKTSQLNSFEAPSMIGDNYGARIRGYLCAPQSGNYVFTIAGDNGAELWLSTDDNPGTKVRIATSPSNGFTSPHEWMKYVTQKSAPVYLQAGKRYYIEALHKEGTGGDNLSVKWQMPNGVTEAPIPGSRLSPFAIASVDPVVTKPIVVEPPIVPVSQPVVNCSATGSILREQWDNITGDEIARIPLNTTPDKTSQLTSFEAPSMIGDNYGARIRGYLCAPQSGNYVFTIAGDNGAQLWLSTDDNPNNKVQIATSPGNGFTAPQEWDKYATQQSAPVYLQAGKRYYIEALHKEGTGGDNLSVKWQMPNGLTEAPIPGSRLSPFASTSIDPVVSKPIVVDPPIVVVSQPAANCSATGTILREHWDNITGDEVAKIPVHATADRITYLTSFEAPSINGDNYGARVRGYLCAPQSGNYVFTIAGDNGAELWLSSDDNPNNKVKIATSPDNGWTSPREWDKYATQQSAPVYLQAGKRYYIEALHKEGSGGDNLAVKWQMPNGVTEAPIPGSRLSPWVNYVASSAHNSSLTSTQLDQTPLKSEASLTVYPNPFAGMTTVQIYATEGGQTSVDVYDLSGKLVQSLFSGVMDAGTSRTFKLNAATLTPGLYLVRFASKSKMINKKITLLK